MADVLSRIFVCINRDNSGIMDFQGPGKPHNGIYDYNGGIADILQYYEAGGKQGYDNGR